MTSGIDLEPCPGCGAHLPPAAGSTHPYIGASAACWALFCSLLVGTYETDAIDFELVDAYSVQHPGRPERRAIQSVAVHLMVLCLSVEHGHEHVDRAALLDALARSGEQPTWLDPPAPNGDLTVRDITDAASPEERRRIARAWMQGVWDSWARHHPTVHRWLAATGADSSTRRPERPPT